MAIAPSRSHTPGELTPGPLREPLRRLRDHLAPLAEREPHQRRGRVLVVVEDAGRNRHHPAALGQLPAELDGVAADVGVDEVSAGRDVWTQTRRLEPRAQLVALDPQIIRQRRDLVGGQAERRRGRMLQGRPARRRSGTA